MPLSISYFKYTNQAIKHSITVKRKEQRGPSGSRSSQEPSLRRGGSSRSSCRPSLRRDRDRGPGRFFAHSLRRALPCLSELTPHLKVRFLAQRWGSSPRLQLQRHTSSSHAFSLRQAFLAWTR